MDWKVGAGCGGTRSVLGEVTVPLDDNRLLSMLTDRRGVLETVLLNVEPTPASQSPLNKVNNMIQ